MVYWDSGVQRRALQRSIIDISVLKSVCKHGRATGRMTHPELGTQPFLFAAMRNRFRMLAKTPCASVSHLEFTTRI